VRHLRLDFGLQLTSLARFSLREKSVSGSCTTLACGSLRASLAGATLACGSLRASLAVWVVDR
jgi:hypothetical protein